MHELPWDLSNYQPKNLYYGRVDALKRKWARILAFPAAMVIALAVVYVAARLAE